MAIHSQKIMLIYPPGENYQRGEDRCQINVDASTSNAPRACNDLGYISAGLKKLGFDSFLKDYQGENLSFKNLIKDIESFNPSAIFISTTNGSIYWDLNIISKIKLSFPDIIFILKGAIFFNADKKLFSEINLSDVDYLIGGESEFIAPQLINDLFFNKNEIKNIEGICYKENGAWIQNNISHLNENVDELPFPDRNAMNNSLYINPDTNKPIATIATSRGCPFDCIYCLSPHISGNKIRERSVDNILEELRDCYFNHQIDNFFFKSDTFTADKNWVLELCDKIKNSDLNGKIFWVANSRVNTIDEEMLKNMKDSGCLMVAFGFESGSQDSLNLMNKHTTVEQNYNAVQLCKKYGIKIFGHFLIGLPWENASHLEETKNFIFKSDVDYIEVSIAVPFKGTKLFEMIINDEKLSKNVLGKDSFKNTSLGTKYLTGKELQSFRKKLLSSYHLRFAYIYKKLFKQKITFGIFMNYVKYGLRMLKNTICWE